MKTKLTKILFDAYWSFSESHMRSPSAEELAEHLLAAGVVVGSPEIHHGCWLQGDYGRVAGADVNYEVKCSLCGGISLEPSAFCPDCGRPMFMPSHLPGGEG